MNDARQNRQPSDGRLFWGIFTLAALIWAVTMFAVSMSRRTPVPKHAGSETPPPANGHRFKSIETAESQAEGKLYRHEEYYPQTGKRKSSEEVYYDDRWSPIRHGQMTAWYENGQRQVEGHWSNGRRVGQWQAWHENGQAWVQGEYDNNEQAQGTWQYYDPQGLPCGQRVQGIKIGEWTEWNLQGDTIGHGSYVEGKQDGLWSFQNSSGQTVLELTFQQGVIDGPAVIHQPHRISYHVEKNKEIPGRRQLALDGRSYSADDPTTGKTLAAFDPPEFAKLHWVPRNGPFDPEPQVTDEESWADGRPKNRLVCKVVVAENEIVHVPHGLAQSWYANGQLHRQQSYRDGLADGVFEEWYDDGKSRYRVEFLLGQPVGDWAFWYQNGQQQVKGKVQAGFVKENWTFWNLDGSRAATPDVWDWISRESPLKDEGLGSATPKISPKATNLPSPADRPLRP